MHQTLIVCKVCKSAAIHGLELEMGHWQAPGKRSQVMVPGCLSTLDHLVDMNISSENKRFWEGNKKEGGNVQICD